MSRLVNVLRRVAKKPAQNTREICLIAILLFVAGLIIACFVCIVTGNQVFNASIGVFFFIGLFIELFGALIYG